MRCSRRVPGAESAPRPSPGRSKLLPRARAQALGPDDAVAVLRRALSDREADIRQLASEVCLELAAMGIEAAVAAVISHVDTCITDGLGRPGLGSDDTPEVRECRRLHGADYVTRREVEQRAETPAEAEARVRAAEERAAEEAEVAAEVEGLDFLVRPLFVKRSVLSRSTKRPRGTRARRRGSLTTDCSPWRAHARLRLPRRALTASRTRLTTRATLHSH